MKLTNKLQNMNEYAFYELEKVKKNKITDHKGFVNTTSTTDESEIIDLSIGDPDLPTPTFIIDKLIESLKDTSCFRYPPYAGLLELKLQIAAYYASMYGVNLDPDREVAVLIGSKEGIAHLILAMTDPGDIVLGPDPAYPVYKAATTICSCQYEKINLRPENRYLPDLNEIDPKLAQTAKLLIVNYPNNPTGAIASTDFFNKLTEFGRQNDILIVNDGAYMQLTQAGKASVSLLQSASAMDNAVEFGTFSKAYNMTGWRLGFVVGNRNAISQLMKIKTNFDSGQFLAIQHAGIAALKQGKNTILENNGIYQYRQQLMQKALSEAKFEYFEPSGTFYTWVKTPREISSEQFCCLLLEEARILAVPGTIFGSGGEGYVRLSLTAPTWKVKNASERLKRLDL